jgi:hypothetical protein
MIINKHGTFYIRSGWPTKLLSVISDTNMRGIFSPNCELDAIDEFGLGRVMIKSLRYWTEVVGLTREYKDSKGMITHEPTELFLMLSEVDKYFQKIGSMLLLHRNLARSSEKATTWYWAFNEFGRSSFTKEEFVRGLSLYLSLNGADIAPLALEKDFNCFKQTYIADSASKIGSLLEEDIVSFFAPLGLLKNDSVNKFIKCSPSIELIPPEIIYYFIIKDNEETLVKNQQLDINMIFEEKLQVCKYLNLNYTNFIKILQMLENKGYLKLYNSFGNKHIELINMNIKEILTSYYGQVINYEI